MTSPVVDSRTVGTLGELLDDLLTRFTDDELVWFRGHARSAYKLECSLARAGGLDVERELMAEFQRDATALLGGADLRGGAPTEWDWLFLMQHYGVPTRLLDWSESPLAALFFALDDPDVLTATDDAAVWALRPQFLNAAAGITATQPWDVPLCDSSDEANWYSPSQLFVGKRNLLPAAVTAVRRFDRIRAQTGVFTVVHKDARPLEESSPSSVTKYVIPRSATGQLLRELQRLGIHASAMYPDLQHLGKRVAERLS